MNRKIKMKNSVCRWKLNGQGIRLIGFMLVGFFLVFNQSAFAADVEINATNFPDDVFRNYVSEKYDTDGDGILSEAEAADATSIYSTVDNGLSAAKNLVGVEYFPNLRIIWVFGGSLESLDLSKNPKIVQLNLPHNSLKKLDVSQCTELIVAQLGFNKLERLDVSKCTKLKRLQCFGNALTSLDVSMCTDLVILEASGQCIDTYWYIQSQNMVSPFSDAMSSDIVKSQITDFKVDGMAKELSQNAGVVYVNGMLPDDAINGIGQKVTYTYTFKLPEGVVPSDEIDAEMDVTMTCTDYAVALNNYSDNNFPDVNFRRKLMTFDYGKDNLITGEEIKEIGSLQVPNSGIKDMTGLGYFYNVGVLACQGNLLTTIDVSKLKKLTRFQCENNKLSSLDLSQNTELATLHCQNNQLESLTLAEGIATLDCSNNKLSWLDVNTCTELKTLNCAYNHLYTLDLRKHFETLSQNSTISPQTHVDPIYNWTNKEVAGVDSYDRLAFRFPDRDWDHYGDWEMAYRVPLMQGVDANVFATTDHCLTFRTLSKEDLDMYGKTVSYDFYTNKNSMVYPPNPSEKEEKLGKMRVEITTYAYCLYLKKAAQGTDNAYNGTLYIDFNASVPDEVDVYISKGLTSDEQLMSLSSVDQVLPANTGVYVKTKTGGDNLYGFYAFNETELTPTVDTTGNILSGSCTATSVTPGKTLTLGHDKKTGALGFWNFSGSTIPAHRAYVSEETLSQLGAGHAKGFAFAFEGENPSVTGISGTADIPGYAQSEDEGQAAWYTLQGIRLSKKPHQGGVYIKNGKKTVIK